MKNGKFEIVSKWSDLKRDDDKKCIKMHFVASSQKSVLTVKQITFLGKIGSTFSQMLAGKLGGGGGGVDPVPRARRMKSTVLKGLQLEVGGERSEH